MTGHLVPLPVPRMEPGRTASPSAEAGVVQCTWCHGTEVRRLRRRPFERLATLFTGKYPFLCRYCHTKFYSTLSRRSGE